MRISGIRIYPFDTTQSGGRTVAYADVEFDSQLLVRGIRILQGERGGLFIGFPSRKVKNQTYRDIIEVLDRNFGNEIRDRVIKAYKEYNEIE